MKNINNLLCLTFLLLIAYSCEPEALPHDNSPTVNKITAGTGDQGGDVIDRKGNSTN